MMSRPIILDTNHIEVKVCMNNIHFSEYFTSLEQLLKFVRLQGNITSFKMKMLGNDGAEFTFDNLVKITFYTTRRLYKTELETSVLVMKQIKDFKDALENYLFGVYSEMYNKNILG